MGISPAPYLETLLFAKKVPTYINYTGFKEMKIIL